MLCICSVIDHKWGQNLVRTKRLHTKCSQEWYLEWSITDSTDPRQHEKNQFVLYDKKKNVANGDKVSKAPVEVKIFFGFVSSCSL